MGSDTSRFDMDHGLARMRERTREAREHEAGQLFSAKAIAAVLSAAAALGQSSAVFVPSVPMDLRDTTSGKSAAEMFKRAGFVAEWNTNKPSPDADTATVLRVSWGADAKPQHEP